MRKRHVRDRFNFRHLEYSKIGLPLMESIQRIMVGAEVFGQILPANRSLEHPAHWGSIFGDPIIATAILDRLLHHSTTINIRGESYRLIDRRKAARAALRVRIELLDTMGWLHTSRSRVWQFSRFS
jgi:IstB-like ATP binding protein